MPSFPSAEKPPPNSEEIYNPDDIVRLYLGDKVLNVLKKSFKERIVHVPIPGDPRGATRASEIFECLTLVDDPYLSSKTMVCRVIGKSDSIIAMVLDDQK